MADRDVLEYQPPEEQRRELRRRRRRAPAMVAAFGFLFYGLFALVLWAAVFVNARDVGHAGGPVLMALIFTGCALLCGRDLIGRPKPPRRNL